MKINEFLKSNTLEPINENRKIDVKYMLQFFMNNISMVDTYDFIKTYNYKLTQLINKETGYYMSDKGGFFMIGAFPKEKIPMNISYEDTLKLVREIEKKYEKDTIPSNIRKDIEKLMYNFDGISYQGKGVFKRYGYGDKIEDVFAILNYIIHKRVGSNRKFEIDLKDKYFGDEKVKTVTIPELQNITVTTYKNGNLKIKQYKWDEQTKELFDIYKKVKYER